ncbi:MAG: hypothetical protein JNL80_03365 [Phycisphaerae bacterium]|jgi:hypothetical protein|nr:hypothetical protein [Phycisphaerae bacterium]
MTQHLFLGFVSIPWDEFGRSDLAAIAWSLAALLAAGPAALAAVLWVPAWRGSPRFDAPHCRGCRVALRGSERSLPERCPECGRSTQGANGAFDVDYAIRAWRWSGVLRRFVLGAGCVMAAIIGGWAATPLVGWAQRTSMATAQVGSIAPALTSARSMQMSKDSLRFAADAAPTDEAVRREATDALRAYLEDRIPAGRGLRLLLDRLDLPAARTHVVDLIGSLGATGELDEAEVLALLRRVTGGPKLIAPMVLEGGSDLVVAITSGDTTVQIDILSIEIDGALRPDLVRYAGTDVPSLTVATLGPFGEGERTSTHEIRVVWRLGWIPALSGDEATQAPLPTRFGFRGSDVVRCTVTHDQTAFNQAISKPPTPVEASPFVASDLQPQVEARSYGRVTLVEGRLQARVLPGTLLPGQWTLVAGDQRLPLDAAEGPEAYELTISGFLEIPLSELPARLTVEYDPTPLWAAGVPQILREHRGFSMPGVAPWWPKPIRFEDVSWRWAPD